MMPDDRAVCSNRNEDEQVKVDHRADDGGIELKSKYKRRKRRKLWLLGIGKLWKVLLVFFTISQWLWDPVVPTEGTTSCSFNTVLRKRSRTRLSYALRCRPIPVKRLPLTVTAAQLL